MFRFPTGRLSIALLAQVVFCLLAAPVIAAQQWAVAGVPGDQSPRDGGVTIQAAFDASHARPEEVSDAEQRRGKSRGAANRTTVSSLYAGEKAGARGQTNEHAPYFRDKDSLLTLPSALSTVEKGIAPASDRPTTTLSPSSIVQEAAPCLAAIELRLQFLSLAIHDQHDALQARWEWKSAVQPTGPPLL